jgi:hypothetical protein
MMAPAPRGTSPATEIGLDKKPTVFLYDSHAFARNETAMSFLYSGRRCYLDLREIVSPSDVVTRGWGKGSDAN